MTGVQTVLFRSFEVGAAVCVVDDAGGLALAVGQFGGDGVAVLVYSANLEITHVASLISRITANIAGTKPYLRLV